MNINQLKYFVTLAEKRSFTAAAEEHYITQTAMTQQIKALEDERIKDIFKDQRFATAIRDSALGALDLPHHELMRAD